MYTPTCRNWIQANTAHDLHMRADHNHADTSAQVIMYIVEHNGSGVQLRTLDYKKPGSNPACAAVLKSWASFFTLHYSSSLSCINEYLAIDSGGYVYEQPSRINYSIWLDASQ